jgi:uncharacterized protein (TIGR02391 family)
MADALKLFERIARDAYRFSDVSEEKPQTAHPFETRDIHDRLPSVIRSLFDNGHYAQATFEALKYVDKEVQRLSGDSESGFKLMMKVLPETGAGLKLTPCATSTEKDEQKGYQFLFAGAILAIRNPRGHEYDVQDDPDTCLDHLCLTSLLLRRLEAAGYKLT